MSERKTISLKLWEKIETYGESRVLKLISSWERASERKRTRYHQMRKRLQEAENVIH